MPRPTPRMPVAYFLAAIGQDPDVTPADRRWFRRTLAPAPRVRTRHDAAGARQHVQV
jgi:hypothetical protein